MDKICSHKNMDYRIEIMEDKEKSFELTRRWKIVTVVTDGSAVPGLGNISPETGMPVMEGKSMLFKEFGGVDASVNMFSSVM